MTDNHRTRNIYRALLWLWVIAAFSGYVYQFGDEIAAFSRALGISN